MTVRFAMHYLPNWIHVTFWSIYLFVLFCFSFAMATKMPKWSQLGALSLDKKSHFQEKSAVSKILSSNLRSVCPACILFTLTAVEGGGGFAGFCWGAEEWVAGGGALCVTGGGALCVTGAVYKKYIKCTCEQSILPWAIVMSEFHLLIKKCSLHPRLDIHCMN